MKNVFLPANLLLPQGVALEKWSVVACDQFTSEPAYWARVADCVADAPSTLHMILPEAELSAPDLDARIARVNANMERYLAGGVFREAPDALVYVERVMQNGKVRCGLVGRVDLEAYSFTPGTDAPVRATEGTVRERIPPRVRVREHAALELPHVLLLADDPADNLLGPIRARKSQLECCYDFELMEQGGHITGWLLGPEDCAAFLAREASYTAEHPQMVFAVGDGNHSLATAKTIWEQKKAQGAAPDDPARYALVELENIHDPALEFEPIHRIVTGVAPEALLSELEQTAGAPDGIPVRWVAGTAEGTIRLDPRKGTLAVGILQAFLDAYLPDVVGASVDYIHGEDVTRRLARSDGAIGFLLPPMEKGDLFRGVLADGALPRKTFSMGHACEKRYYLEGRRIR